tara:strand:- start:2179 stop:3519 length:1341 start_codon:yes stop_codon:yes gene_type:complete
MVLIKFTTLFFLLITSLSSFAEIKTSYTKIQGNNPNDINFEKIAFTPFQGVIRKGIDVGWYAIKIENITINSIVSIPPVWVTEIQCYQEKKELLRNKQTLYHSYKITKGYTVYLLVKCKTLAMIPIIIEEEQAAIISYRNTLFVQGIYYGISVAMIVLNVFYFMKFHNKVFIYYSLFLFSISSLLFIQDSLLQIITNNHHIHRSLTLSFQFCSALFGFLFANTYLNLKTYYPQFKYVAYILLTLVSLGSFMFLFTDHPIYFIVCRIGISILHISCWIMAILLLKKESDFIYYIIAYTILIVVSNSYFFSRAIGIDSIDTTTNSIKIGGVIEMLLLGYAVVLRMSKINLANKKIRNELYHFSHEVTNLKNELSIINLRGEEELIKANLNQQEIKILRMISEGKTNQEISGKLFISINTVKYHNKNLYAKLNIKSRKEAKIKYLDLGF